MNKILINAAEGSLDFSSYESPKTTVLEIATEGILCASGQFEEYERQTLEW